MRGLLLAIIFVGLGYVGFTLIDPSLELTQEEAIQLDIRNNSSSEDISARVNTALETSDYDSALMYSEIADYVGFKLSPEASDAMHEASGITATIIRNASDVLGGFVTGEAQSAAGLGGAVASDLTVVGDVRDISYQAPKMLAGEPYNELILGLSVVGVGVTGATVASGGGGLPGRFAVSLLKVAAKTGSLTADFSRTLTRMVGDAVNFPGLQQTLRSVRLSDSAATREAVTTYARSINTAELAPIVARMNDVRNNAGAAESVRLMRYVRNSDDLDDIAGMSASLGRKTRGVAEITGKTSLRSFRTTMRIVEFILENILAFLAWLGSAVTLFLSRTIFKAVR